MTTARYVDEDYRKLMLEDASDFDDESSSADEAEEEEEEDSDCDFRPGSGSSDENNTTE